MKAIFNYIKQHHLVFWSFSILWLCFVAIVWYYLFSKQIEWLKVPQGESGYTFGYFIGALGVGAVGLILLGRRTHAMLEQVENERSKVETDYRKMVNENFTKSIELLGQTEVTARQGGIYALQRLLDEKVLYSTLIRIISAFIRESSKKFKHEKAENEKTLPVDIEAALITIRDRVYSESYSWEVDKISKRNVSETRPHFDLSNSYLINTDLVESDFRYFNISDSEIIDCDMRRFNFTGAIFSFSVFNGVELTGSDFTSTKLNGVNFINTDLSNVIGLVQSQLDSALGSKNIQLPTSLKHPTHWT